MVAQYVSAASLPKHWQAGNVAAAAADGAAVAITTTAEPK